MKTPIGDLPIPDLQVVGRILKLEATEDRMEAVFEIWRAELERLQPVFPHGNEAATMAWFATLLRINRVAEPQSARSSS
ncbi:MAG: hypothetical protein U1E28_21940 [Beijerinckiaceae bacterium]